MKKSTFPKLTLYIAGFLLVVLSFTIAYARYPSVNCDIPASCTLQKGEAFLWDVLSRQLMSAPEAD